MFGELRRFKEDPIVPGTGSVEGQRHTSPMVGGKPQETSTFSKYLGGWIDGQESYVPLRWRSQVSSKSHAASEQLAGRRS